ncbi:hypothetical protein EX895_001720 [Sporisorium graminicola]|uniref:Anaphase-promoting complex subunit 4 WD40 domain-containing protein n=1 Tax=Sporisorium graminicola TaxID=280036 RepID=A0A4V6EUD2_9BASI|nr:hypothetical protein EX895_001720 [Sporisorium graminicola]TKY89189.1 hypothetical protein EX895_001720 [Sporisorium graminicola]
MSLQFLSDKESLPSQSHPAPVVAVCWVSSASSSSQGVILSGDCQGNVKVFDAHSALAFRNPPKPHRNAVHCISTNDVGSIALSNAIDGTIALWDLIPFRASKVVDDSSGNVGEADAVTQEPALLPLPVDDPEALLLGTIDSLTSHSDAQTKLSEAWKTALHPSAPLFAAIGAGARVSLHALPRATDSTVFGTTLSVAPLSNAPKDAFGLSLAFHPSGTLLAVGTNTGQVLLYTLDSASTLTLVSTYLDHPSPIRVLSFTQHLLLCGSDDRTISVHDVKPILSPQQTSMFARDAPRIGATVASLSGHKGWVLDLASPASGESNVFASIAADKSIKFWDLASPTKSTPVWNGGETQPIAAFCFQPRPVDSAEGDGVPDAPSVATSSSMTRFVTASQDGRLRWYRGAGLG